MTQPHSVFCDDYDPNSLSIAEASQRILQAMAPHQGVEWVSVRNSLGRILANDLVAPHDVPAHRNSAMDGYAFRGQDLHDQKHESRIHLKLVGVSAAGHPFQGHLPPMAAVRIMTGAVVPDDADTVIMQERVSLEPSEGHIAFNTDAIPALGSNIRLPGEDLKAQVMALPAGRLMRPADIGLAASLGLAEVPVRPQLRVAFFSTGDELCSLGQTPKVGQVFDSNRYTLFAMLEKMNVEWHDLGVVKDSPEALEEAFQRASQCADVIISSGGVSVGDADFVRSILDRLGRTVFWKIAIKPGRPFAYGQFTGDKHFFGLPGNPVAVMVTFYQIVRPALMRLQGRHPLPSPLLLQAKTRTSLKKMPGRFEFQRGVLYRTESGDWQVDATGEQGSGMLSSMSLANCFIRLPESSGKIEAGAWVEVEPFDACL